MDDLSAVTDLLHGAGETMLGHEFTNEEAVARVREQFPGKPFCLVRDWIWIDLSMPDSVRAALERTARQPVMLYAHQVVQDSLWRFAPGDWVRSTPLVAFTEGCFFETGNSVYVLLGHGVRKTAELSTVNKVF
jgi:hypothetical protein